MPALLIINVVFKVLLREEQHRELGYLSGSIFFKGFFALLESIRILRIDDDDLLPFCSPQLPLIIASNHPSLWDAPLLLRKFPRMSGIMKAEILNNPILKHGSSFIGFLPNRPILTMVRSTQNHLKRDGKLLLFPEGTRTRMESAQLNPFQPGLGFLAKKTQVPILPVFIFMDSGYVRKRWPIWKMPHLPITVSIKTGELQRPRDDESNAAFSERLEDYFKTEISSRDPFLQNSSS